MKNVIKGLAVLLIAVPVVGAASILAFGVWTAFMIMFVMIQSIRWRRDTDPCQTPEPNLIWKNLKEFRETSNWALRNLQGAQRNSVRQWAGVPLVTEPPPTFDEPTAQPRKPALQSGGPTVESEELAAQFGEPFRFATREPAPAYEISSEDQPTPTPRPLPLTQRSLYLERPPRCLKCSMPIQSDGAECTVCGERTPGPTPQ